MAGAGSRRDRGEVADPEPAEDVDWLSLHCRLTFVHHRTSPVESCRCTALRPFGWCSSSRTELENPPFCDMLPFVEPIAENLERVHSQIAEAAGKVGRSANEIELIAIS